MRDRHPAPPQEADTLSTDRSGRSARPAVAGQVDTSLEVLPIPAFKDNYLWLLHDGRDAVVVDPGDANPVEATLARLGLTLRAILVTHSHGDHIGGIAALLAERPDLPVYGPAREPVPGLTHAVGDGSRVTLRAPTLELEVLDVPGHTVGHVAYYGQNRLFCGDTLFACGCGRIDQPPAVMYASLERLAALPDTTQIYCTHEYTQANIRFALTIDAENPALQARAVEVATLRDAGRITLPSTIALERASNPFFRCAEPTVVQAVSRVAGAPLPTPADVFARLRAMKNAFR
jgi:hydroxyacylglutathione hydrolase